MLKILLPLVVLIGIPVLGVLSVQAYFKRKRWGRPISPSQEVAPRPGLPRHRARRRSSRAALALAISLLVAVAGTGGYFAGRHRTESQRHDSRPAIMPADFQQLQVSRLAERKRLAATRGPSAQAAVADDLAGAYARTRAALDRGAASPALLEAVSRARRAYAELSAAARRRNRPAYDAASRSVRAAERQVDEALRGPGS